MEGAILNAFYPLVISETFTLVPFCFLCACLANLHVPCATYLGGFFSSVFRHIVTPLKLHYQVTHGHIGALIGISSFPYFKSQPESQTEVDAMSLREATVYGRSHTEHFLPPCVL